jgi:CheY-like chemotaxis protein
MFLDEILKNTGATILWAKDGIEAIELCRQHEEIDLVLMDIKMPRMNGFEATRQIKLFRQNLHIIAQTAYAMTDDREKARDAGCDNYISKPIDKSDLFTMIYNHFTPNMTSM